MSQVTVSSNPRFAITEFRLPSRPVMVLQNTCILNMCISLWVTPSGILLEILKPAGDFHKLLVPLNGTHIPIIHHVSLTTTIEKDTIPS